MNYYAIADEAIPGGPFSFEIDTTGLAVWTLWKHADFLPGGPERRAYLDAVCPAIARGADALAACDHPDDPDPRLQCLANEDDNLALTQGLQGAETTILAISSPPWPQRRTAASDPRPRGAGRRAAGSSRRPSSTVSSSRLRRRTSRGRASSAGGVPG